MGNATSFYTQTTPAAQTNALGTSAKSSPVLGSGAGTGTFLDLLLSTLLTGKNPTDPAALGSTTDNTEGGAASDGSVDPLLALQTISVIDDQGLDTDKAGDVPVDAVNLMIQVPVADNNAAAGDAAAEGQINLDTTLPVADEHSEIDPALLNAIEPGAELDPKMAEALKAQLAALGITVDANSKTAALPADLDNTPTVPVAAIAGEDASDAHAIVISAPMDESAEPTGEVAAQLNALNVGAGEKDGKGKGKPESLIDAMMRGIQADDGYKPTLTGTSGNATPQQQSSHTLPSTATPSTAMDMDAGLGIDDPLFKVDLGALSPDKLLGLNNSATQVTANAAKHASGTQAQAALGTVALHLQQMAQNRDTRSLTLQLNPPELGKMQIKMSFGRDKTVKADIAVEKGDTLAMLQKDADGLRQALADAGLSPDAGSLSFSLANDNTFADQMRDGNGSGNDGGTTSADGDTELTAIEIKSSEEWSVDSRTGIVRYNIVV